LAGKKPPKNKWCSAVDAVKSKAVKPAARPTQKNAVTANSVKEAPVVATWKKAKTPNSVPAAKLPAVKAVAKWKAGKSVDIVRS